ncbi:MAG: hypothetical protein V9E90_08025 [Saprospiraceae bacterium]
MMSKYPGSIHKLSSIFYLVFIFCFGGAGQPQTYKQQVANKILDKLYEVSAYPEIQKPKLIILPSKSLAAQYVPSSNTIFIEDALYLICRSFGKDSLNALAFIISHELTHAIYKDLNLGLVPSSYLNYAGSFIPNEREEQVADLQGSFLATLSGYPTQQVLSGLIEKIYDTYHIEDKPMDAYPPKYKRVESAQKVLTQLQHLLVVFENANWLVVKSEYELAQSLYDYILQYYQGLEIYNNKGLALALQAMRYYNEETDSYVHPLELDQNSRLKKFNKSRGDLTSEDLQKRMQLLKQAKTCFESALSLNQAYLPAKIHMISCYNLMNQPEEAVRFYETDKVFNKKSTKIASNNFQINQAIGISYALLKNKRARRYFNSSIPRQQVDLASNANYNLELYRNHLKKDKIKQQLLQPFACIPSAEANLNKTQLFNENFSEANLINFNSGSNVLELKYKIEADKQIYLFKNKEVPLLSIIRKKVDAKGIQDFQKMQRELDPACQSQQTSSLGRFYSFESFNMVFLTNNQGMITEQFQFIYN